MDWLPIPSDICVTAVCELKLILRCTFPDKSKTSFIEWMEWKKKFPQKFNVLTL